MDSHSVVGKLEVGRVIVPPNPMIQQLAQRP